MTWQLGAHAFMPPILPVVSGSQVEISNVGQETHILYSANQPDLVPRDPIGPSGTRTVAASGQNLAIQIQSRGAPHRVDRNGKFKIENVPAGRWTVKVWYRDGWLALPARAIDVPGRGEVRIELTSDALAGKPVTPVPGQK